jgi:hypothetical protein
LTEIESLYIGNQTACLFAQSTKPGVDNLLFATVGVYNWTEVGQADDSDPVLFNNQYVPIMRADGKIEVIMMTRDQRLASIVGNENQLTAENLTGQHTVQAMAAAKSGDGRTLDVFVLEPATGGLTHYWRDSIKNADGTYEMGDWNQEPVRQQSGGVPQKFENVPGRCVG